MKWFKNDVAATCRQQRERAFTVSIGVRAEEWEQVAETERARLFADIAAAICQSICACAATSYTDEASRIVHITAYDPTT